MGNIFFKKLKKYDTLENLSLIENDYASLDNLEIRINNNTDNITEINEKLNDFNKSISTNFNLVQNDIKCIYKELLDLKKSNSFLPIVENNNFTENLFSSVQSVDDDEDDNHQSLFK